MMRPHWEHFHHVADIGIRGYGENLAQAFEQAALAMTAVITDPVLVRAEQKVDIQVSDPDPEMLFVDWLNAIIYEMAVRRMLFSRFQITRLDEVLRATCWGEPVEVTRHQPAVEVKGATFTALALTQQPDTSWIVQCVVDV